MKLSIVIPVYNEVKTLEEVLQVVKNVSIPLEKEIILVDDCSSDGTYELALRLGLTARRHPRNLGYGANQKTCYALALGRGACGAGCEVLTTRPFSLRMRRYSSSLPISTRSRK